MRSFLIATLLCLSIPSFAKKAEKKIVTHKITNTDRKTASETCPDEEKLDMFCSEVGGLTPDDEGGEYKYYYQRQLFEAACVTLKDPLEIQQQKISEMWKKFENGKHLICNNLQFDVVNGSVIKYAISRGIDPFVRDAIRFKLNLNKLDKSDGRTILDYVKVNWDRARGLSIERTLKYYYEILRAAGAKHKSEL